MPGHGEAEEVLALWREVERDLEEAAPGSAEEERLRTEAALLRDEYHRLIEERSHPAGSTNSHAEGTP